MTHVSDQGAGAPVDPQPAALTSAELADLVGFAGQLADVAGPIARRYFRSGIAYESKSDHSPVSQADREIEVAMREQIARRHPDHAILGEEYGSRGESDWCWVLDPIDGTKSFLCGLPLFGTLIALLYRGRPLLGVIDMPILGERWQASAPGAGSSAVVPATLNGRPAHASGCADLSQARLFSTSPDLFRGEDASAIARVERRVALRRFGGDCYQYGLLASGHCDLVIEAGLQRYDVMALVPVIEAAGGLVRGWDGAPVSQHFDGRVVAAATADLLDQVLEALAGR